ncbi:MAG: hypothetical protein A4E24_02032 [Methanomethylovorans sp. PtaU1.Bin093]|uniref:TIGR00341 family protein n=1 Tax=Methanomethylovorans sp. PtaU1.Bin093 TaxID=1811679 RepID=UPI0009D303A6|nr:TIGR00341 family protein [Methanomethylovorans sp. PtaU1.Bin093]OPY18004.1 MAG: hypothetical protein A4E24_02032 [Methanomethylovorans sp. PtaU1.Bin093]
MGVSEKSVFLRDGVTYKTIRDNAFFSWSYFFMNILATVIASYGLLANSPAVVIGAMIIAMLLEPIIGMGLALADNDHDLFRTGVSTLIKGVIGIVVTAFIIGLIHRNVFLTNEIIVRTAPNIFDLMIGLAGGAAAAYATISPRLNTGIVGVAISTALVPPLASGSILLSRGEITLAMGAFLLVFTNMVAIQFAASVILWLNKIHKTSKMELFELKKFIRRNIITICVLILLGLILSANLQKAVKSELFEESTKSTLDKEISFLSGSYLIDTSFEKRSNITIVRAVIGGLIPPSAEQVGIIEDSLPAPPDGNRIELRIRFVQMDTINRNGLVYADTNFTIPKTLN